jgi:peptidase M48-like protein
MEIGDVSGSAEPVRTRTGGSLEVYLQKPYLELFQLAPKLKFDSGEVEREREAMKKTRASCIARFKARAKQYDSEMRSVQSDLKHANARNDDSERHAMHCKIQNLRTLKSQADVLATKAIPIAYDNLNAKLQLIERWPGQLHEVQRQLSTGAYRARRWGDVKDIGFREIAAGQQKDIKAGQDAIKQMKLAGMMPPEIHDEAIEDYVRSVAERVAARSDLHVPLHVTVLNSKEINAFALPGGYLFVERGLLDAADDESELAGVLAHEISHDVARHSHKLMVKATVAGIFYQSAELAAVILTGGIVGLGTYYALQYGFYGLGLVLDLKLLGVSREYELEADQLGIQYTWNSGYDPSGFIRFFDKIATREGYVNGVSWFRTHPPFYERMVSAEREIMFLPKKEGLRAQSARFEQMKARLKTATTKAKEEEKGKPSLLEPEQGCPKPEKIEYKPGQPIGALCSAR